MQKSTRKHSLMLRQLETLFAPLRAIPALKALPGKGWVHAVRQALGMSTSQLAARVGVHQSRISRIESDEIEGALTLKTLKQVADAMDCDFVYSILPRQPLEKQLEDQANKITNQQLKHVIKSMALEDQMPTQQAIELERKRLIQELLSGNLKHLWNE